MTVPEDKAANVLYINGTLIHRVADEIPESNKVKIFILSFFINLPKSPLDCYKFNEGG